MEIPAPNNLKTILPRVNQHNHRRSLLLLYRLRTRYFCKRHLDRTTGNCPLSRSERDLPASPRPLQAIPTVEKATQAPKEPILQLNLTTVSNLRSRKSRNIIPSV